MKTKLITLALTLITSTLAAQQRPDFGAIAARLPKIAPTEGRLRIPLSTSNSPYQWRGIDQSVSVSSAGSALTVRYTVAEKRPAGATLIVPAGTFGEIASLHVRARSERTVTLVPTLQNAAGVVFAFPAITLPAKKEMTIDLSAEELRYFAPQATAPEPDAFDPAEAIMLTFIDISGFMGGADGSETSWTIASLEGVVR